MAIRQGLPDWMKWTLGVAGVVVVIAAVSMVFGHNPLQHLMAHAG